MACVATDNRFVWVNSAFERLTGYSRAELTQMDWMDITIQTDIGGDLASVKSVVSGEDDRYTISKRYRHKLGKDVPIVLSVWRFPRSVENMLACFIVEAVPEHASVLELDKLRNELQGQINQLRTSMIDGDDEGKSAITVSYNSQNADRGGSNSNNNATVMVVIAAVVMVAFIAIAALFLGGTLRIDASPDGGGAVQVEGD